jgi:prepilin-type N-terminal cleavage/methylation domain-containing protein
MHSHVISDSLPRRHPAAGFTMIEVMIAMAIFAVGILAVFSMQITAMNQNSAARMQTEATAIAAQQLELLMALPYDNLLLSADEDLNPHQRTVGGFSLEWDVTTPDPADLVYGGLPIKRVNLTVSGGNPNARPVAISFIRSQ